MEQLKNEIMRIVSDRWKMNESPTFLAFLGARLRPELKNELRQLGLTLKSFVRDHMSENVRYFTFGDGADALVPAIETKGITDAELVARRASVPRRPPPPRYLSDVWKAFERPMQSEKRYLEFADNRAILHNLSATDTPPDNSIEVRKQDVPQVDPMRGVAAPYDVGNAIQAWAEANSIEVDSLYEPSSTLAPAGVASSSDLSLRPAALGTERLIALLEILDQDDLKKINIPSDVLLNILKWGRGS